MHSHLALALLLLSVPAAPAESPVASSPATAIDSYVAPFVDTNNFSGVVLVARGGDPVFTKAYGFADREARVANGVGTRFHIASMSMQFTAAAALRLIDQGKLDLGTPVSKIIPGYPDGKGITVEHLLTETSGIADINAQPDYADVLKRHQTPQSLVDHVRDLPPLRKPGTFEREEHSAYNLLALIIEKKTGLAFPDAVRELVFQPLGMADSGIDDDSPAAARNAAKGYQPTGLYEIKPADPIHWSAKAGNASAYTTADDELKFNQAILGDRFLSARLRAIVFDTGARVGYGWFKSDSRRFDQPVFSMNGRSPGFSSAVADLARDHVFVVVLSNLYNSAPSDVSLELAAILNGRPYQRLALKTSVDSDTLSSLPASFQFEKDFYQADALVRLHAINGEIFLDWPSGIRSALIPTTKDHFVDRNFWVPVEIVRNASGEIEQLKYDRFLGKRVGGGN